MLSEIFKSEIKGNVGILIIERCAKDLNFVSLKAQFSSNSHNFFDLALSYELNSTRNGIYQKYVSIEIPHPHLKFFQKGILKVPFLRIRERQFFDERQHKRIFEISLEFPVIHRQHHSLPYFIHLQL